MSGINNEKAYTKVINIFYPNEEVTFENLKLIFQNNFSLLENNAIIDVMKEYYGVEKLTKSSLSSVDIGSVYSENSIKDGIMSRYALENKPELDDEKLLIDLQKFNPDLNSYSLKKYLENNNIENIENFKQYIIQILK